MSIFCLVFYLQDIISRWKVEAFSIHSRNIFYSPNELCRNRKEKQKRKKKLVELKTQKVAQAKVKPKTKKKKKRKNI